MDDTALFLARLCFPYLGNGRSVSGLRLEMRSLAPKHRTDLSPAFSHWFPLTVAGCTGAAVHAINTSKNYNVYAGVLPRRGQTRHAPDVAAAGYLWCEIDGKADGPEGAGELLISATKNSLPTPSMVVNSGGGLHIYWPLSTPFELSCGDDIKRFNALLLRLAYAMGGLQWDKDRFGSYTGKAKPVDTERAYADPVCADVARILRIPGTRNHKPERLCTVKLQIHTPPTSHIMTLSEWERILPKKPVQPPLKIAFIPSTRPGDASTLSSYMQGRLYQTVYPVGQKFPNLRSLLFYLRRRGWENGDLQSYATDFCNRHGRMDMRTVNGLVESIYSRVGIDEDVLRRRSA